MSANVSRPIRKRPVVAIDGPAGVGKSTTARAVAKQLGYVLVDTGALYRGVALASHEKGIDWANEAAVTAIARTVDLSFSPTEDGSARLLVNGTDRADDIRTPELSSGASRVSAYPGVRAALLDLQRQLGHDGGVVLEGRDIGTVVFPDAEVKIFLTASPEERARRRVGDLRERGLKADYHELLGQMQARDKADSTREIAPLKPAPDAVELDSTRLDESAVVARVLELARAASESARPLG